MGTLINGIATTQQVTSKSIGETITSVYGMGTAQQREENQTVTFRDSSPQWSIAIPHSIDSTRLTTVEGEQDLNHFMSRPILIQSLSWTPGAATLNLQIDPWTLFFTNARVVNRICNYFVMAATLKVKFTVDGNSFYYGRLMVDYTPRYGDDLTTSLDGVIPQNAISASQRMHLFIDPCTSQGGIMSLPHINYNDVLSVPNGDVGSMGVLYIRQLVTLKHANASTDPITVKVYAWAENVRLSIPTTNDSYGITPQADEYTLKPFSSMASTAAEVSGAFSSVPVIGPYAKATQMMAMSLGKMAKLFGFSRPANLADDIYNNPRFVGTMANTDRADNCVKLAYDSKQELTVDPRVCGADTGDEMDIRYIVTKESYLTQFPWTKASGIGTLLWNAYVLPTQCDIVSGSYYMTACCFGAMPFKYWRGTMRYRFQVVCSSFHRGRLLIQWDPLGFANHQMNTCFSKIVDITADTDFVIDVSWGQPFAFLPILGPAPQFAVTPLVQVYTAVNGILSVQVENVLSTPNSTINNDIAINVFVSMCDDADFAKPTDDNILNVCLQAEEFDLTEAQNAPIATTNDEACTSCIELDNTHDVYFGEVVRSFRTLLKRYNFHSSYLAPVGQTNWALSLADFPYHRGSLANGIHLSAALAPVNYVHQTLLNYLSLAYVGMRGGIRSKYVYFSDKDAISSMSIERSTIDNVAFSSTSRPLVVTSNSKYARDRMSGSTNGLNGTEVTISKLKPVLEIEHPMSVPVRYLSTRWVGSTSYLPNDQRRSTHRLMIQSDCTTAAGVDRYVSIGEDFSFFLFQGAPPLKIAAPPAA